MKNPVHLTLTRPLTYAMALILALVASSCSGDKPTGHGHDDVFRVGLALGPDEIAPGGHLPLTSGEVTRVVLNLYNEHGARIKLLDHYQISLAFTPATVASATPVAGTTTFFDVSSSAAPETPGTLMVTVYHPHTETTKSFGPYDILIH